MRTVGETIDARQIMRMNRVSYGVNGVKYGVRSGARTIEPNLSCRDVRYGLNLPRSCNQLSF